MADNIQTTLLVTASQSRARQSAACQAFAPAPSVVGGFCVSSVTCGPAARRAAIACLLLLRGPSTVAGLVMPVRVDAIQAVSSAGATPHVLEEGLVGVQPALADSNASAAVVGPLRCLRIRTTIAHVSPRDIFGERAWEQRVAVPAMGLGRAFALKTSAAAVLPQGEIAAANVNDGAALTAASPRRLPAKIRGAATYDGQPVEDARSQVDEAWHAPYCSSEVVRLSAIV